MKTYKAVKSVKIDDTKYLKDETFEISNKLASSEEVATLLEGGEIVAVEELPEVKTSEKKETVLPTTAELETIKADAKAAKDSNTPAEDISNEERNSFTGQNMVGVNSPDPSVGDIVPTDIVMPGQVVDPKTGKVLEGGVGLSTPQPLAPKPAEVNRHEARDAGEWVGHHTI